MPLLELFNQVFRGFYVALTGIEFVCPRAARMAVHFDERAAFFACQTGSFFLHLAADPFASGGVVDGEIADAGKVALQRDLGDEMQREKSQDARGASGWKVSQISAVSF